MRNAIQWNPLKSYDIPGLEVKGLYRFLFVLFRWQADSDINMAV